MSKIEISNFDDVIDSRDLMEYIDENLDEMEPEDRKRFLDFAEDFEANASDYIYGDFAIHDTYFTMYCRDFVLGVGYLSSDLPGFIEANIDWHGVADDLRVNYTSIEFGEQTYWVRL